MANNIVPAPPGMQAITKKGDACDTTWLKWFRRLQLELSKFIPVLGSPNQILGMNAAGTATEFKTLTDGNGIDITFPAPGNITITVRQSELSDIWEAALIY